MKPTLIIVRDDSIKHHLIDAYLRVHDVLLGRVKIPAHELKTGRVDTPDGPVWIVSAAGFDRERLASIELSRVIVQPNLHPLPGLQRLIDMALTRVRP